MTLNGQHLNSLLPGVLLGCKRLESSDAAWDGEVVASVYDRIFDSRRRYSRTALRILLDNTFLAFTA